MRSRLVLSPENNQISDCEQANAARTLNDQVIRAAVQISRSFVSTETG